MGRRGRPPWHGPLQTPPGPELGDPHSSLSTPTPSCLGPGWVPDPPNRRPGGPTAAQAGGGTPLGPGKRPASPLEFQHLRSWVPARVHAPLAVLARPPPALLQHTRGNAPAQLAQRPPCCLWHPLGPSWPSPLQAALNPPPPADQDSPFLEQSITGRVRSSRIRLACPQQSCGSRTLPLRPAS